MNFATKKFNTAVTNFKALCGTHQQLYEYGQFYITKRTEDALLGQITADLSANIRLGIAPDQVANLLKFFETKVKVAALDINVAAIRNMLDLIEVNGDMAAIRAMFGSTKQDQAHVQSEFNEIWPNTRISTALSYPGSPASLGKILAANDLEKDKCYDVLRFFAAKLLKQRANAQLKPTDRLSVSVVGGAQPQTTAPGVPASLNVAAILARETLVYARPNELKAATDRMRSALDAHGYVHCGVLSGVLHDHSKFPNPEHHILVFEYDQVEGQDAFLFWDPDTAHSNLGGTGWGDGFGVLFSRDGRLCTGVDDADLADIERTKDAKTEGNHLRDMLRHSYQVYSLQTLPIPARVKLHVKVLSAPVRASVDDMLGRAVSFFAANDLEVVEISREILATPGTDLDRFQMLFVGAGPRGEATAEVTDLHTTLRQPRDFGVTPAASEVVVVFVDSMVPAQRGFSSHPLEQPGVVISSALATEWTLAYEIGRVIGLLSSVAPGDLTYRSTDKIGEDVPLLSVDNLEAILTSPLVEV